MKITFLGDIMAEPPVLKAAKQKDGTYCFDGVFAHVQSLLDEADYVIGNLETPLAGEEVGYSKHHLAFNAPDTYADAVKKAGIKLVATANNHTFDRGYEGMVRTIQVLDEKGIGHAGSYLPGTERPEAFYFTQGGVTVAVIAYTYGTNYDGSGGTCLAEGEYANTVNLLRSQKDGVYLPGVFRGKNWVDRLFPRMNPDKIGSLKKFLGMCTSYPRDDDKLDKEAMAPYVAQFQSDIRKAKEKAEIVLFYPHMGGQFNLKPGYISQYVAEKALEAGADGIIASHSHALQPVVMFGSVPCAYSLGNFNMNPLSTLAIPENVTQYGIALHLYVEDRKIQKVTFSILLNHAVPGSQISGYPVDELYQTLKTAEERKKLEKEVKRVYGIVAGRMLKGEVIRREYALEEDV